MERTSGASDETELRSLVDLLDDEDPRSLDLVRRHILEIGERVRPFLEELRSKGPARLAGRAEELLGELRFRGLRWEFEAFTRQRAPDLETGAFLVARFGYPNLKKEVYQGWLDRVAKSVQRDLPLGATHAVVFQRLNSMIFHAMGFAGNEERYYDPDNSYLNRVIETRRGIPVTLSVLYMLLAKRLDLPVYGVSLPGHFLVGFGAGGAAAYLDAFRRGKVLDLLGVRRMLSKNGYAFRPEYAARSSSREILARMIRNLLAVYDKMGAQDRVEKLTALLEALLRRGASAA